MSIINAFLAAASGGFEYEEGSFTPTSNASNRTVNFSKTHTKPPAIMACIDTTQSTTEAINNAAVWSFFDLGQLIQAGVYMGYSAYKGIVLYTEINGTNIHPVSAALTYGSDSSQTGSNSTRYFATESSATFRIVNATYTPYFCANRKYVWIAIWLPDSWVQPS